MLFFLHKCFIYDKDAGKQIRFNEKTIFIAFVCMNIGFVQEQSITQEQANNLNPSFLPNAKAQRHKEKTFKRQCAMFACLLLPECREFPFFVSNKDLFVS